MPQVIAHLSRVADVFPLSGFAGGLELSSVADGFERRHTQEHQLVDDVELVGPPVRRLLTVAPLAAGLISTFAPTVPLSLCGLILATLGQHCLAMGDELLELNQFRDLRTVRATHHRRAGLTHSQVIDGICASHPPSRVGPVHRAVRMQPDLPSLPLLHSVVASTETHEIARGSAPERPGHDMVDVALPCGHDAARESAVAITRPHQALQPEARSV